MTKPPTPLQTLILWGLLVEGGAPIATKVKPGGPADRAALKALGFVADVGKTRPKRIEVTERGWAWAAEHLDAEISTRSPASGPILRAWLTRLKLFLDSQPELALASVLAPPKAAPTAALGDVRARVRAAYWKAAGGRYNARGLLRDIRRELPDMERAALDAELLRLQAEEGATLMPLDNRAAITPADEEAAIFVGGEARHLIWIAK